MMKFAQFLKPIMLCFVITGVCLFSVACAGSSEVTESENGAKLSVTEKATEESTTTRSSNTELNTTKEETTKQESTTQSESLNELKNENESEVDSPEISDKNTSEQIDITYANDKVIFMFKDNSGNAVDGIDVIIEPHANEIDSHTDIAEIVGTSDDNGIVAWKPIEGKHFLEASKGNENQEYAIEITESDIGSVIELTW